MLKKVLPVLFLLCAPSLWATTRTAATCNAVDIQTQIGASANGDTVVIPPGNCTFNTTTGGVNVTNLGINLVGTGTPDNNPLDKGASGTCTQTVITVSGVIGFKLAPNLTSASPRLSCISISYGGVANSIAFEIAGVCTTPNVCTNVRVDNLTFPNWAGHALNGISFGISAVNNIFGVIDHNTITGTQGAGNLQLVEFSLSGMTGSGNYGDVSWNNAESYGSLNALFIENNAFDNAGATENEGAVAGIQSQGGGRIVVRFNQFTIRDNLNFVMGWHGTESSGRPRSTRSFEFYGNTIICPNLIGCPTLAGARGGTGLAWGNTITMQGNAAYNGFFGFSTFRTSAKMSSSWGACDGTTPYDGNDGTLYFSGTVQSSTGNSGQVVTVNGSPGWSTNQWAPIGVNAGAPFSLHDITLSVGGVSQGGEIVSNTANTLTLAGNAGGGFVWTLGVGDQVEIRRATWCIDQAGGRGAASTVFNATANPASPLTSANEVASPSYFWENISTTGKQPNFSFVGSNTARVIPNRDWYTETFNQGAQTNATTPFNGTSGVGHGTFVSPNNRPTTCTIGVAYFATDQGSWNSSGNGFGQGQLYICTATNTWTTSYTPAPYPNPLITGAAQPQLVQLSADKKFLINQVTGAPVFIVGDAPQEAPVSLTTAQWTTYLNDRKARGINAVWIIAADNCFGPNPPHNLAGNVPFDGADFTAFDGTYWTAIDGMISQASAQNMIVFFMPFFTGNPGESPSAYYTSVQASSTATLQAFGTFLGNRYKGTNNIIWVLGGDTRPSDAGILSQLNILGTAIFAADPNHLMTLESCEQCTTNGFNSVAAFQAASIAVPSWLTLNWAYPQTTTTVPAAQAAFNQTPFLPPISGENFYELENNTTPLLLRWEMYSEILSGTYAGRIFGNGALWSFNSPNGSTCVNGTNSCRGVTSGPLFWQNQLSNVGSVGEGFQGALFNSREHQLLVPDTSHTYLLSGFGTGTTITTAARTSDGQSIIVYDPLGSTQPFTMNLSGITSASSTVRGWWYYPQTGAASLFGTRANSGNLVFTPPDNNDWVLVLDDAGATLTPPGGAQSVSFSPPGGLNFGSVNVGTTSGNLTLTITSNGPAPLTWASVSQSAPANVNFNNTGAGTCPLVNLTGLAVGQSCTFILNAITNVPGLQSGTFNLPSNAPGSPQTVPLQITGVGGTPAVSLNPTSLIFPLVNLGSSSLPQTSILLNTGTANLTWTSLVLSGPFTFSNNNCPLSGTLTANSSCNINVIFNPLLPGTQTGSVTLIDNAPGSPHVITLTGTGQALGVPTQVFAINLAGCKAGLTTTWCFTADGKIYVDVCNPVCGTFKPLTMSGTLAGTTVVN